MQDGQDKAHGSTACARVGLLGCGEAVREGTTLIGPGGAGLRGCSGTAEHDHKLSAGLLGGGTSYTPLPCPPIAEEGELLALAHPIFAMAWRRVEWAGESPL
jgi:hypothetical protein